MFDERNPIQKTFDNAKAGLTIRLDQEERDPFEVTIFLKKPGTPAGETADNGAVSLSAKGSLRLTIGQKGFVEIFAENAGVLRGKDSPEEVQA
jgi:hypothetical protein